MSNQLERQNEHPELFGADIILPSQFFDGIGGKILSAEQRLMLAVLVDAINVCQGWQRYPSACKRRDFAEAGKWLTTGGDAPFSFDNICEALNINPAILRARLATLLMGVGALGCGGVRAMRLRNTSRHQRLTPNRVRQHKRRAAAGATASFLVGAAPPRSESSAVEWTE